MVSIVNEGNALKIYWEGYSLFCTKMILNLFFKNVMEQISHRFVTIQFQNSSWSVLLLFWNILKATFPVFCPRTVSKLFCYCSRTKMGLAKSLICSIRALDAGSVTVHGKNF